VKTRASAHPTVTLGLSEHTIGEEQEDEVEVFFTPPSSRNTSTNNDSSIVNGEPEKE